MEKSAQEILDEAGRLEIIDSVKRATFYRAHEPLFKWWIKEFMKEKYPGKHFSSSESIEQMLWQKEREQQLIRLLT